MTEKQIEYGFWVWDTTNDFPPASIAYPNQYKGESKVNIACTQRNDLTSTEQKKLVKEWCDFLPKAKQINFLWFTTTTPQVLFDSICSLDQLVGLNIKNSNISTLENIKNLTNLKYLRIGGSPGIESIEPLKNSTNLEVLVLEGLRKISDFSLIGELTNLKFLSIEGGMYTMQKIESLNFVSQLKNLIFFSTTMISTPNTSFEPILKLKNLITLNWPFTLTDADMKRLKIELPNLKYLPNRYDRSNQAKLKDLFK